MRSLQIQVLWVYPHEKKDGIGAYSEAVIHQLGEKEWNIQKAGPPQNRQELEGLLGRFRSAQVTHVQYDPSYWTGENGKLFQIFASNIKAKLVLTHHEIYEESPFDYPYSKVKSPVPGVTWIKKWRYRKVHPYFVQEQRLAKQGFHAEAIQVHNPYQADILAAKGISPERIHVIPQGVPQNPSAPLRSNPDCWHLGTFGFINPSVNYDAVLETLAKLDLPWIYKIGGGPRLPEHQSILNHILEKSEQLSIQNKVQITGYLKPGEVEGFFTSLDLYLAPFKFKSSSASLNWAASFGLPVLAPTLPLIRDTNQRCPFIAMHNPSEPDSLLKALLSLIETPHKRKALAHQARLYAEKYSFKREAEEIAGLYKRCLRSHIPKE